MISAREIAEIVRNPRISVEEAADLIEKYSKTVASFALIDNTAKVYADCIDRLERVSA